MEQFKNKRIFVSGGTGFFGKSLLHYFNEHLPDTEVWIMCRKPEIFIAEYPELCTSSIRFVRGDLLSSALPCAKFNYVIHAATCPSNASDVVEFTVKAAKKMIDFAACNSAKTLFLSSGAVYGEFTSPPSEKCKPAPQTAYGCGKALAEELYLSSGLPVVIERGFCFSGRYIDFNMHYALTDFIRAVLENRLPVITGNHDTVRSYLSADEWVEWSIQLLATRTGIYNVGGKKKITIGELAQLTSNRPLTAMMTTEKPGFYVPDISKIENELGVKQRISLEESIKNILNFHKERNQ